MLILTLHILVGRQQGDAKTKVKIPESHEIKEEVGPTQVCDEKPQCRGLERGLSG